MDNTTLHRFELVEKGELAFANHRREGYAFNILRVVAADAVTHGAATGRQKGQRFASFKEIFLSDIYEETKRRAKCLKQMVGAAGFEPTTPSPPD